MYTREQIEKAVKSKGYVWFENVNNKGFDVGIRNSGPGKKVTNVFDDFITISYKENGIWKFHEWSMTADHGEKSCAPVIQFQRGCYSGTWAI